MNSSRIIRLMTVEDIEEVANIEQSLFSLPWTKKDFLEAMEQTDKLYLCVEEAGRVIAYCGLTQVLDEGYITNVAVSQEYQNQGIGFDMLKELFVRGSERGIRAFTLEVREHNTSARKLYGKLGFEEVGIRKNFYSFPKENAVIMWKYY